MTHRVDPAVEGVKPPGPHAVLDRPSAQPLGRELRPRDDAVLPRRDLGHDPVTWSVQCIYFMV
jgi:hypothetical protein